jgi:putative two-component system response regulator
MVVDDVASNLRLAKAALSDAGDVFTVTSPEQMFELLGTARPHLILLDINMPGTDGFAALKALKADPLTADTPVIFLTGRKDVASEAMGLRLGAVDYISKPFEPELLKARVGIHLTIRNQRLKLEAQSRDLARFSRNLKDMVAAETSKVLRLQGAVFGMVVDLVESRSAVGGGAGRTVRRMRLLLDGMRETGTYRGEIRDWDRDAVVHSSVLHDVGKISVSDAILAKPGKLDRGEFEEMKRHTTFGSAVLDRISAALPEQDSQFIRHARHFAASHHERWDGSGYPEGLSAEGIPLQGRMMAICDVYDALVSKRPYKEAIPPDKATGIILRDSGAHFDPALVEVFSRVRHRFAE